MLHPSALYLDEFKFEDQRTVRRDAVEGHGAISPLRGNIELPLVTLVHPREGDLLAHDEFPDLLLAGGKGLGGQQGQGGKEQVGQEAHHHSIEGPNVRKKGGNPVGPFA